MMPSTMNSQTAIADLMDLRIRQLPEATHRQLKIIAVRSGKTLTATIIAALQEYVARHRPNGTAKPSD